MSELTLRVPATSANLGLGFDSMGVAVDKFLTIKAVKNAEWSFQFAKPYLETLPDGKNNLVAETACQVARQYGADMPALHIVMDSEIPLTHGLGSSSSAVVAGIELADHYCRLGLSDFDKILIGSKIEGHPDNIGPCITGGVFVGFYHEENLNYYTTALMGISLITSIPEYEISTLEARAALPDDYSRTQAVEQNAKNNVMLLALWNKDYELMGRLMMEDNFHEPYRRPLIKEYDAVKKITLNHGAYATVISGAGPTLLTLCPEENAVDILKQLENIESCTHQQVNVYYNQQW